MEFSLNHPTYLPTHPPPEVSTIVLTIASNCSAVSGSASTWFM